MPELPLKTNRKLNCLFIHEYEILNIIKTFDINKAVGEDKISHLVLKKYIKIYIETTFHVI